MYSFANDAPAASPSLLRGRVSAWRGGGGDFGGRTDGYGGGLDRSSRGGGGGGKREAKSACGVGYNIHAVV